MRFVDAASAFVRLVVMLSMFEWFSDAAVRVIVKYVRVEDCPLDGTHDARRAVE